MLALSISSPKAIIQNEVFLIPQRTELQSYIQIFSYPNFFKAYGNTVFYTVGGRRSVWTLNDSLAYPLSKTRLKGVKGRHAPGDFLDVFLWRPDTQLPAGLFARLDEHPPGDVDSVCDHQFNLILLINFFNRFPWILKRRPSSTGSTTKDSGPYHSAAFHRPLGQP
jgi:putative aldouronate transport system permease protein